MERASWSGKRHGKYRFLKRGPFTLPFVEKQFVLTAKYNSVLYLLILLIPSKTYWRDYVRGRRLTLGVQGPDAHGGHEVAGVPRPGVVVVVGARISNYVQIRIVTHKVTPGHLLGAMRFRRLNR